MTKRSPQLALAVIGLLLPLAVNAGFKCWTNKEGIRECGNVIPPEYRAQQTEIVNERGMTIDIKERAKTPEEIAAEQRAEAEAKKARKAEEKRKREQAAYDNVLLSTFSTDRDIIDSRDRNLSAIEGTIEITRITRDKLQTKLDELNALVERKRGVKAPISDATLGDIDSLEKQIARKNNYIQSKQNEAAELSKKYDAYLERFCQLRECAQD